jgi:glycosyltransferase involved in cell wall biosynthesis
MIFALRRSREFDVVHDHTGLLGLALGGVVDMPFCHTVHGPLDGVPGVIYEDVLSLVPRAKLISISLNQRAPKPSFPWIANCPNALDLSVYPFRRKSGGDYLLFLGRMSPDKGAHRALAVALETGLPLKIAAKCREPAEIRYFDEFVRPHLGGGIEYVGEVGHADKVELLMGARALLCPIDWEEPFGLVVIEAMACGTPVIATRRGAIPEIIEHGSSGILVDNYREMEDPAVLAHADRLDPAVLRKEVEERFSPEHMVANYVAAYQATIEATVSV